MRRKRYKNIFLLLVCAVTNMTVLAQNSNKQLEKTIIKSHTGFEKMVFEEIGFKSSTLNEERKIWISLPEDYHTSGRSYPVMYVLDAQSHFKTTRNVLDYLSSVNKIPSMILVGLPLVESGGNLVRDRIRDYSPTHVEVPVVEQGSTPFQKSGNAHVFREFIAKEVFSRIEKDYRTKPFRILAGHSQGGLFVISSLTSNSDLFNAYIAASPSLWWDDGILVKQAEIGLDKQFNHHFYMSLASGDYNKHSRTIYIRSYAKILQIEEPTGLNWRFDFIENESHSSTVLKSYYSGLEFIYQKWALPSYRQEDGVAGLKAHFNQLSQTYGYQIRPTETMVNQMGYGQVWAGQRKKAIELFLYNTKIHPNSANAYDSLAEGYMLDDQKDKAISNYQKSLKLDANNPNAVKMLRKLLN